MSLKGLDRIMICMIADECFHLLFLRSLIAVYLLVPILYSLANYESGKYLKYACIMFVIFAVMRSTLLEFTPDHSLIEMLLKKISYPLIEHSGYFILGYYLSTLDTKKYKNIYLIQGKPSDLLYGNFSLPVFIEGVLLYVLFQNNTFESMSIKFKKSILFLSQCSFGVYLIHPFIIDRLRDTFDIVPNLPFMLTVTIITILVIISIVITAIIRKIPFLNKWII
ncbi:MAG: hypothetical protein RR518_07615 [Coprobacillus sp.]